MENREIKNKPWTWHVIARQKGTDIFVLDETGLFGRETKGEIVLASRLSTALERLNLALPTEAIAAAVDELTHDLWAMRRKPGKVNLNTN